LLKTISSQEEDFTTSPLHRHQGVSAKPQLLTPTLQPMELHLPISLLKDTPSNLTMGANLVMVTDLLLRMPRDHLQVNQDLISHPLEHLQANNQVDILL